MVVAHIQRARPHCHPAMIAVADSSNDPQHARPTTHARAHALFGNRKFHDEFCALVRCPAHSPLASSTDTTGGGIPSGHRDERAQLHQVRELPDGARDGAVELVVGHISAIVGGNRQRIWCWGERERHVTGEPLPLRSNKSSCTVCRFRGHPPRKACRIGEKPRAVLRRSRPQQQEHAYRRAIHTTGPMLGVGWG